METLPSSQFALPEHDEPIAALQAFSEFDVHAPPEASETRYLLSSIGKVLGPDVEDFIEVYCPSETSRLAIIGSIRLDLISRLPKERSGLLVLQKVNNSRRLNKFFRAANSNLEEGGVLIGFLEPKEERKRRLQRRFPSVVGRAYYYFDFLAHRLSPKIPGIKKLYFALTKGRNRPLSIPETLGRLVSCGFGIIDYREIEGAVYFAVRKEREAEPVSGATYGPLCTLNRIGKDRKVIKVYKLRTMHPYSEFLQAYLFEKNGTRDGDKIVDDFRVTNWASIIRRLWLDEAPMMINWLKGELKLIGVRPLSLHKFSTYPEDLQELRTRFKPGLLPPYYADLPKTVEEFFETEKKYLLAYQKAPLRTDIRYFFRAVNNILIKRARSA